MELKQLLQAALSGSRWGDALVGHLLFVEGIGEGVVLAYHEVLPALPPSSLIAPAVVAADATSTTANIIHANGAAVATESATQGIDGRNHDGVPPPLTTQLGGGAGRHTIEFSAADDAARPEERTIQAVHLRRCRHTKLEQQEEEGRRWLVKLPEPRLAIEILGRSPLKAYAGADAASVGAVRHEEGDDETDGDGGGDDDRVAAVTVARAHLEAVYSLHNPQKLADIDKLLVEWAGREHQLLANVERRYGGLPAAKRRVAV